MDLLLFGVIIRLLNRQTRRLRNIVLYTHRNCEGGRRGVPRTEPRLQLLCRRAVQVMVGGVGVAATRSLSSLGRTSRETAGIGATCAPPTPRLVCAWAVMLL